MKAEKRSARKAAGDSDMAIYHCVEDVKREKASFRWPGFGAHREAVHSPWYSQLGPVNSASFLKQDKQREGKDINQRASVRVGLWMA